jgi:Spy/CpxP family protein refolding chaperone
MKKTLLIGIPLALTVLLLVTLPSFGFGRMMHGHHGMMKDFMFYQMDRVAKELNLNASQQAQFDNFKKDLASNIDQRQEKRQEIHDLVRQELDKNNPDFSKITPMIHTQIDSTAEFAHDTVNRLNEFLATLTPEQKQILAKRIEEFHQSHGE